MRRILILGVVSITCWGLAMACSGGGGEPTPGGPAMPGVSGAPGGAGGPGGSGSGSGGGSGSGSGEAAILPAPQFDAHLLGKAVSQDGSYAAGKLTAHANDSQHPATSFHWTLVGPGISGGAFGDGADFSFDLPAVTDKSNYVLTLISSLDVKTVQQELSFFTVPAPTAKVIANINQASGIPVLIADGGIVPKGQKVTFSADAKFASQYKWQISKDGAKATVLGTADSATLDAKEIGKYQVALMAWGEGSENPAIAYFNLSVADNNVTIVVIAQVSKPENNFTAFLQQEGKYPQWSVLDIDASGIGEALKTIECGVTTLDKKKTLVPVAQSGSKYQFQLNTAGNFVTNCKYTLKEGYVAANALESSVEFTILPKAVALMTVNGQNCNPATPLLFEVGSSVTLSAEKSTGNVTSYSWMASSGVLKDDNKINASLTMKDATDYVVTLNTKGIGDSSGVSCTVYAKSLPQVVIAQDATVRNGQSYMAGSYQRAHATVISGTPTSYNWRLLNAAGDGLQNKITQNATDVFEFMLSEAGPLNLSLQAAVITLAGPSNKVPFISKVGQISLVTPLDFSKIQSIVAISKTDAYFASPAAIFHLGADGRVVQVRNIAAHPAQPNGFFARHAGDVCLLTTDGGFWRYTYKNGWEFKLFGIGTNGVALTGSSKGTDLLVAADNNRLYAGDAVNGGFQVIGNNTYRFLATIGNAYYSAPALSTPAAPGVLKCSLSSCVKLSWAAGSALASDVAWKAIGASLSTVYLSDSNGRILTVKNGEVAKFDFLPSDEYVVAFSQPDTALYAITNKGSIYRMGDSGSQLVFASSFAATVAGGTGSTFYATDDAVKEVKVISNGKPAVLSAQPQPGGVTTGCADQKRMWMVGDMAYISVCVIALNQPIYTPWAIAYDGDFKPLATLSGTAPILAIARDEADRLFIMRSTGIQQVMADGTAKDLVVPLDTGESFTGLSGKFLLTTQGIRLNKEADYPLVSSVTDARHPAATGDVVYYTFANDTRLGRLNLKDLAGAGGVATVNTPVDGPIMDILMDANQQVYVLTQKTVYRFVNNTLPMTAIYTADGKDMKGIAGMNGRHLLISMGLKGLVYVDVDGKFPQTINISAETPVAIEVTDVEYNGTVFLIFGRNDNGALQLHQFGAPQ